VSHRAQICLTLTALLSLAAFMPRNLVLAASTAEVSLNVQNAAPRQVEDTTQKAVARDYATAWQAMAEALDRNQVNLLTTNFAGTALEKLTATIGEQSKTGLHQRFIDKGHKVEAIFYSPEGSAMELQDTLQLQIQLMDGDKVIRSEDATVHYIALLTAAENSWKVRVLQAVPSF
jgi:hypothetical protein